MGQTWWPVSTSQKRTDWSQLTEISMWPAAAKPVTWSRAHKPDVIRAILSDDSPYALLHAREREPSQFSPGRCGRPPARTAAPSRCPAGPGPLRTARSGWPLPTPQASQHGGGAAACAVARGGGVRRRRTVLSAGGQEFVFCSVGHAQDGGGVAVVLVVAVDRVRVELGPQLPLQHHQARGD